MPKKGGRRKKRRTHAGAAAAEAASSSETAATQPRSMIVRRGRSKRCAELVRELRKVFAPYTAAKLRERASTSLKDLTHAAQPLGVSHLILVAESAKKGTLNVRIARLPAGPTLHFKVDALESMRTVRAGQKRPVETTAAYATAPLVVTTGFQKKSSKDSTAPHLELARATLENAFPAIDVETVRVNDCRRVVLCALTDAQTATLELRHYAVRANVAGVSAPIRRVVEARAAPDLSKLRDVADYVTQHAGDASDSEAEEKPAVEMPGKFAGRGNAAHRTSAIKLHDLGPRLTLRLYKVEKDVCSGDVLYHAFEEASAVQGDDDDEDAVVGEDAGEDSEDDDDEEDAD